MKQILLFSIAFIMTVTVLKAQTITSSNMPSIGENYSFFNDTLQLSEGPAGNGVTWNFSNLTYSPTLNSNENYISVASTNHSTDFPSATVAEGVATDTNFTFYKLNSSSYEILGTSSGATIQSYSDPIKLLQFPFSSGSTFTDNFSVTLTVSGLNITISGTSTAIGDGTGTLNLPNGQTVQALRIKQTFVMNTSIAGFDVVGNNYITTYVWLDPATKNFLFQVAKDSTISSFPGSAPTTNVSYNSKLRNTNYPSGNAANIFSTKSNVLLSISPNPCSGQFKISYTAKSNELISVSFFDVSGKLVSKISDVGNSSNNGIEINTLNWEKGIYFVQITQDKYQVTKKLVVN